MSSAVVHVVDVGHGNCTIAVSGSEVVVVDAAPGSTVKDTLNHLGIRAVSRLILSHVDSDHAGGADALLLAPEHPIDLLALNADATKRTRRYFHLRVAIQDAVERTGLDVETSVWRGKSEKLSTENIGVQVLLPRVGDALAGPGGQGLTGSELTSNSMSAVVRLVMDDLRVLLPADSGIDALDQLEQLGEDVESDVLVFPHHGGLPDGGRAELYAERLASLVKPSHVLFSIGRFRHENPRPEVIRGVRTALPSVHLMCTQLSMNCEASESNRPDGYLTSLPAAGRRRNACCGGTISVSPAMGTVSRLAPSEDSHGGFIDSNVSTPLCRRMWH